MSDPNAGAPSEPLQFDRAEPASPLPGSAASQPDAEPAPFITCSNCQTPVKTYYYNVDDNAVCAQCKQTIARASGAQSGGKAWLKAAIFGFGAAVVGAVIYYGVIAITNFEIGIVAILIGFLVGAAVRKGASGGGGRRYQILAIGLTYFSVGMAYSPLVFKGFMEGKAKAGATASRSHDAVTSDAAVAVEDSAAVDSASADVAPQLAGSPVEGKGGRNIGALGFLIAAGLTFVFIFALPVIAVLGSLPGGIISALIIGVGMRTAWRMTAGHVVSITGPYKVGGEAEPAPASA